MQWHVTKGTALYYLGKYEEAIATYDKAIEIDPQYADAWNNKGSALGCLGKYEEAIAAYDKAIEIDPQYAVVCYSPSFPPKNQNHHRMAK